MHTSLAQSQLAVSAPKYFSNLYQHNYDVLTCGLNVRSCLLTMCGQTITQSQWGINTPTSLAHDRTFSPHVYIVYILSWNIHMYTYTPGRISIFLSTASTFHWFRWSFSSPKVLRRGRWIGLCGGVGTGGVEAVARCGWTVSPGAGGDSGCVSLFLIKCNLQANAVIEQMLPSDFFLVAQLKVDFLTYLWVNTFFGDYFAFFLSAKWNPKMGLLVFKDQK